MPFTQSLASPVHTQHIQQVLSSFYLIRQTRCSPYPYAPLAKWSKFITRPHQVCPSPDSHIGPLCAPICPTWEWAIALGNLLDTLLSLAVPSLGVLPGWAGAQVLLLQWLPLAECVKPWQGSTQLRSERLPSPSTPVLGLAQKLPSGLLRSCITSSCYSCSLVPLM